MKKTIALTSIALTLGLGLAGCGQASTAGGSAPETSAAQDSAGMSQAGLTIDQPWVKATDKEMTGVFGTIKNTSDKEITITAGASEGLAKKVELHETTADPSGGMSMKEKEGGFVIPAGGQLELKPGGEHVMLMGLMKHIAPGDTVKVVLQTSAGEFTIEATAKEFAGAKETYAPSHGAGMSEAPGGGHEGHDHGSHEGHDHGGMSTDSATAGH